MITIQHLQTFDALLQGSQDYPSDTTLAPDELRIRLQKCLSARHPRAFPPASNRSKSSVHTLKNLQNVHHLQKAFHQACADRTLFIFQRNYPVKYVDIECKNDGVTELGASAKQGYSDNVQQLLAMGANPFNMGISFKDVHEQCRPAIKRALFKACLRKLNKTYGKEIDIDSVLNVGKKINLGGKIDVDFKLDNDSSALDFALCYFDVELVETLLDIGANPMTSYQRFYGLLYEEETPTPNPNADKVLSLMIKYGFDITDQTLIDHEGPTFLSKLCLEKGILGLLRLAKLYSNIPDKIPDELQELFFALSLNNTLDSSHFNSPLASQYTEKCTNPGTLTCIGSGSFGKVYKIDDQNAAKVVSFAQDYTPIQALTEFVYAQLFSRKIYQSISITNDKAIFIMKKASCNLGEVLFKGVRSDEILLKIAKSLTKQVARMHDKGIVHRDLKTGNVLVFNDKKHNFLLCDFGTTMQVANCLACKNVTTEVYASERALKEEEPYTMADDIYSLGAIFYEMATKRYTWPDSSPTYIKYQLKNEKKWHTAQDTQLDNPTPTKAFLLETAKLCMGCYPKRESIDTAQKLWEHLRTFDPTHTRPESRPVATPSPPPFFENPPKLTLPRPQATHKAS
ncbi:MAG: protein kinase family protein [bacterium]